jgi:ribosomal protein S27AE
VITTKIRLACGDCGGVSVAVGDVALVVKSGGGAGYRAACPRCGRAIGADAAPAMEEMLLALGAPLLAEDGQTVIRPARRARRAQVARARK